MIERQRISHDGKETIIQTARGDFDLSFAPMIPLNYTHMKGDGWPLYAYDRFRQRSRAAYPESVNRPVIAGLPIMMAESNTRHEFIMYGHLIQRAHHLV